MDNIPYRLMRGFPLNISLPYSSVFSQRCEVSGKVAFLSIYQSRCNIYPLFFHVKGE